MHTFDELLNVVRKLRSPDGCPWDRAQKADDYKKYLLEEAYELFEGIDEGNYDVIKEELGDLFLVLLAITEIFHEKGQLSLDEVLRGIKKKLISRHPHVFSSKKLETKEAVLAYWVNHKAKKKKRRTMKERLPRNAPALFLAEMLFRERRSINKKENGGEGDTVLLEQMYEAYRKLEKKPTAASFEQMLMALCHYAFLHSFDLELLFKQRVIREAQKEAYSRQSPRKHEV